MNKLDLHGTLEMNLKNTVVIERKKIAEDYVQNNTIYVNPQIFKTAYWGEEMGALYILL